MMILLGPRKGMLREGSRDMYYLSVLFGTVKLCAYILTNARVSLTHSMDIYVLHIKSYGESV